jgi:hypothetical protein
MLKLFEILSGLVNVKKDFDVRKLPSQGLFYNEDFKLQIKKADIKDIIIYENNYIKDDLGVIINEVKNIVKNNVIFKNGYSFDDLKSVDVIFLFLEIVKLTTGKNIEIQYVNEDNGKDEVIKFEISNFNYHNLPKYITKYYDSEKRQFLIDGYMFSLPSIGVENCLTNFLIKKSNLPNNLHYNDYSYDFTYFLGNKNSVSFDEVENLVQIFNFDLDEVEKNKVKRIIDIFQPLQKYSLLKDGKVIDINSKIDLEKIWK